MRGNVADDVALLLAGPEGDLDPDAGPDDLPHGRRDAVGERPVERQVQDDFGELGHGGNNIKRVRDWIGLVYQGSGGADLPTASAIFISSERIW